MTISLSDSVLRKKYIELPFSVIDTKTGPWKQRRKLWYKLGIQSELGRGENHSINEVAEMFRFGNMPHDKPPLKYIDPIPGETRNTLCKSELARKKLRWKPKINLEDWIKNEI